MPETRKMTIDLQSLPKARISFVEPMLAKPVTSLPESNEWTYEIKLDGYRAVVVKTRNRVALFSRRGNNLNNRFPQIARAFDFLPDETVIDGEIVALDEQGRPSFANLTRPGATRQRLYFYAFDVLAYLGRDVKKVPLLNRRSLLDNHVLADLVEPVRISSMIDADPHELIEAIREQGLEGIIAKRVDSVYESGERSGNWVKFKTDQSQEFVIGGYKPAGDNFEYLLAGYYESNDLIFIAKIKNGFVPALRREVAKHFKGLVTNVCPFANLPEPRTARRGEALTLDVMKKMRWLKPRLVAQIEYTEWTKENHLRHSRFAGLRDDKNARQVVREE
jgi:bifunctional non-homologous end joining protein LigD